jgi:hypothetical protein
MSVAPVQKEVCPPAYEVTIGKALVVYLEVESVQVPVYDQYRDLES